MKVLLCIFSGTGNTVKVSERLSEELAERGFSTEIYRIRESSPMPGDDFDLLIVGYPVHAFNAPKVVLKFLKRLNKTNLKKPAYLIRTSGEPLGLNDASGITPKRILKKLGYDVKGEFSFVMPYNIIFRHSDGMAARMWQAAQNRIKLAADKIATGEANKAKVGAFKRAVSFTLRIEHTAMPFIGKRFKAYKEKCVRCGVCVRLCPCDNIILNGDEYPIFGKKCVGCMACAFGCPNDAIKISLLNGWRVNGKYSFDGPPATDDEVCSYCKKSYLNYFHNCEN